MLRAVRRVKRTVTTMRLAIRAPWMTSDLLDRFVSPATFDECAFHRSRFFLSYRHENVCSCVAGTDERLQDELKRTQAALVLAQTEVENLMKKVAILTDSPPRCL